VPLQAFHLSGFGFDYERYYEERGFYYDLDKVYPGGVLKTEDEVWKRIDDVIKGVDKDKYEVFRNKYIEAGGHATEKVLDELSKMINN
jgi:CDP-Glycerol:Poly(glycerophosphate) glycerophosphotransferase.